MGRITVRDLVETAPADVEIVIADYNDVEGKKLAKSFKARRHVKHEFCDVTDVAATAKVLKGAFATINSVQHQFNLRVMKACLSAGTHYCDLGGLFHVTREQLELHSAFKKKRLLALLGIGAAPGVVNVLARSAADKMDEVHEIHCIVGNVDMTEGRPSTPLGTSYSIQTILEEASLPAAFFTGGKFTFVDAMSGAEEVNFPAPVGIKKPACTIHSEVATLPLSYKNKGVREVSFKIAFSEDLDEKLRFLKAIGMISDKEIRLGKAKVTPRDVLLRVLAGLPKAPPFTGVPNEYEVVRAVVRGVANGKRIEETVDCHTPGLPEWGFGVDVDTGCPPSIAMQMLARGEITGIGALPPEVAIPAEPFFRELEKRKMKVERSVIELGPTTPAESTALAT
jgi:saccharopine dehydrogenase-like NADP-dependent oxidoreductase